MVSNLAAALTLTLSFLPYATSAGMYSQPVVNLDAKTFKSVMAEEHAAVCLYPQPCMRSVFTSHARWLHL